MDISEIELEVGSTYQLRNGFKTGKVYLSNCGTNYKFQAVLLNQRKERTGYMFSWLSNGSFLTRGRENRFDIIKKL
tara:strand:+ start:5042 stop:5269 length:228 start_codon:yes stop_codon:yes gene_type:complete